MEVGDDIQGYRKGPSLEHIHLTDLSEKKTHQFVHVLNKPVSSLSQSLRHQHWFMNSISPCLLGSAPVHWNHWEAPEQVPSLYRGHVTMNKIERIRVYAELG